MAFLLLLLMLAFLAAAIVLLRNAKKGGPEWATPAGVACAVLALIIALFRVIAPPGTANQRAAKEAAAEFQDICGTYVGNQLLADAGDTPSVVLLVRPGWVAEEPHAQAERVMIEALQQALKAGGASVDIQELPIPDRAMNRFMVGLEDVDEASREEMEEFIRAEYTLWFKPRQLYRLLLRLDGQADYAVCTMPLGGDRMANGFPRRGKGPKLVLLEVLRLEELENAFAQTSLHAVVVRRSGDAAWKVGDSIARDLDEAFAQRYEFVTEETLASVQTD